LTISWEWEDQSAFVRLNQWQGTRDTAAFLAVFEAVEFMEAHDWDSVRAQCHVLVCEILTRLIARYGIAPLSPISPECPPQAIGQRLRQEHRIEVPTQRRHEKNLLRVSV
jgi:hypothetical protein